MVKGKKKLYKILILQEIISYTYSAYIAVMTEPICISWEYKFSKCCQNVYFYVTILDLMSFIGLAQQTSVEELF